MIPTYANWVEAIHAWHEALCAANPANDRLPYAVSSCVSWIDSHSMLPAVCYVDTSSRALQ